MDLYSNFYFNKTMIEESSKAYVVTFFIASKFIGTFTILQCKLYCPYPLIEFFLEMQGVKLLDVLLCCYTSIKVACLTYYQ